DLNGIGNVIGADRDDLFVAVSRFDTQQVGEIRRLSSDGHLVGDPLTPTGQLATDLAVSPSGHLVYADINGAGLRVYDLAAGHELTTAPLDIGLSPVYANAIACLAL